MMKKKSQLRNRIFPLSIILLGSIASCNQAGKVPIPQQANDFCQIYQAEGDTFPGPTTTELIAGEWYEEWVPNDHTFTRDQQGYWHIFGITHPLTSTKRVHEGEFMSFHAISPANELAASVKENSWKDLPKVLTPAERPGERLELWAPFMVRKDDLYYMYYSPNQMRLAVSLDLMNWEPRGILFEDAPNDRDPSIFFHEGIYHMVYTSEQSIKLRSSEDLLSWTEARVIFESEYFTPESPTLLNYQDGFYLFVCGWDGIWDQKEVSGAYQHETYVYYADNFEYFDSSLPLTTLYAHAPEIIQAENGQWYISSVEWPVRGISMDRLNWK